MIRLRLTALYAGAFFVAGAILIGLTFAYLQQTLQSRPASTETIAKQVLDDLGFRHRARKAAKRARYAAELTQPGGTKASKRARKHFKNIQRVLGDHQDTVVARSWLRRIGAAAGTTQGENGFTFGLLYGREEALAAESRRAAEQLR